MGPFPCSTKTTMPSSTNLLLLHLMISALIISPATAGTTAGDEFSLISKQVGGCKGGSIAECMLEMEMESESTRRMLETTKRYISYGALGRNYIPCSQRGASYYNCRSGGEANPYQRGCSAITRCRR